MLTHAPLDLYAEQLEAVTAAVTAAVAGAGSGSGPVDGDRQEATAAAIERARCTEAVYVQALGVAEQWAASRHCGELLEAR
ncbi:hypothetical protein ACODT5_19875 [Streptomyces sp. 5.8]|uniref:hypothetical protein n=1 Tax=Streptomyces sp. 5.8 TaxID=3406571 RepID=UPI003BB4D03D